MQIAQDTFYRFTEDIRLILGDNLFEIIIHGSYVLHDFRANLGDLDFIVLTNDSLDEQMNKNVFRLHEKYRSEKSLLLHQLEGTYYPKSYLMNLNGQFLGCYIGTSRLKSITTFQNSFMDLRLVNQHGLMLLGNTCDIYNPSESELLNEQKTDCLAYRNTISRNCQSDIGLWISLIHWSTRTLFYLSNVEIESKTKTSQWCAEQSDLEEFQDLFNYAKKLRFPYKGAILQDGAKASCIRLLDLVDSRSNN